MNGNISRFSFSGAPRADSHQRTVAEIRHIVFTAAGRILFTVAPYYSNGLIFLKAETGSQFFIARKAGYKHPPPLDS